MRRVSSRPRLVSHDDNDQWHNANIDCSSRSSSSIDDCDDDNDYYYHYYGSISVSEQRNRSNQWQRQRQRQQQRQHATNCIKNLSHVVNEEVFDEINGMLCDDTISLILMCLHPADLRSLQVVNLRLNALCRRRFVWEQHLWKKWSVLKQFEGSNVYFCDDYHLPCAASNLISYSEALNFSLLHGISTSDHPTCIHQRFYNDKVKNIGDKDIVQFQGRVGESDRSVLADVAFPSVVCTWEETRRTAIKPAVFSIPSKIMSVLCRGGTQFNNSHSYSIMSGLRPFVAPYVSSRKVSEVMVNVTPRLVAYYEVTIFPDSYKDRLRPRYNQNIDDCIAVGVATSSFNHLQKMPGWDQYSYGYHSDDGGIFHARGDMIRRYGPKFGQGDTVGCGINYANNGIFFTMNGLFLGYAWSDICTTIKYYPAIGIDSNSPLLVNFGRRPFQFDLTSFHEQYSDQVNSLLRTKTDLNRDTKTSRIRYKSSTSKNNDKVLFHHGPGKRLSSTT